jgi:uncharacterized membrane protein YbhN (UPF0104 family)
VITVGYLGWFGITVYQASICSGNKCVLPNFCGVCDMKILFTLGGLLIAIVVIANLVDIQESLSIILQADIGWIFVSVFIMFIAPVTVAIKLWLLIRVTGEERKLIRCHKVIYASLALNMMIPGRGGDLARVGFLVDENSSLGVFAGVVAVERVIDLISLSLLVVLAGVVTEFTNSSYVGVVGCAISIVMLGIVLAGRSLPFKKSFFERISRSAMAIISRPLQLLYVFIISISSWLINIVVMLFSMFAVGLIAPLGELIRAAPIGILAGIVPVSVSGIGTRDAAILMLLKGVASPEMIAAGTFLYTLIFLCLPVVGSTVVMSEFTRLKAVLKSRKKAINQNG